MGRAWATSAQVRRAVQVIFTLAFLTALTAGVAGLILDKVAPVQ